MPIPIHYGMVNFALYFITYPAIIQQFLRYDNFAYNLNRLRFNNRLICRQSFGEWRHHSRYRTAKQGS